MTEPEKAALLWDERCVENRMLTFGHTLDRGDWDGHRECFTDVVTMDFKRLTGFDPVRLPADQWVSFARAILSPVRRHHQYSNFRIRVTGDQASATLNHISRHWKSTDTGSVDYTQYGSYDVRFVRSGEDWKIAYVKHDFQWSDGNNALFDMRDPALVEAMPKVFSEANIAAAKKYLADA